MPLSRTLRCVATSISSALIIAVSGAILAADAPATAPQAPSKAMRDKMATVHEQMAACLRSDKSISECRTEMMTQCRSMMGAQGCQMMMGMGGGRMGMQQGMRGRMMTNPPSSSGTPK